MGFTCMYMHARTYSRCSHAWRQEKHAHAVASASPTLCSAVQVELALSWARRIWRRHPLHTNGICHCPVVTPSSKTWTGRMGDWRYKRCVPTSEIAGRTGCDDAARLVVAPCVAE
eukprot:6209794-Pleurochrysis_carterae.AAC.2